ncbi:uncharacterized protein LOC122850384 [Aphidius gifuensis]|uniref:uncharacterized protein LOC122850384 n=1 Tax=Aphidius gifuensis TaxID=684658 RepID=UPI001CDC89A7|nr:uncharacterized protein LOC122850384 [Aphidius gifuensis]
MRCSQPKDNGFPGRARLLNGVLTITRMHTMHGKHPGLLESNTAKEYVRKRAAETLNPQRILYQELLASRECQAAVNQDPDWFPEKMHKIINRSRESVDLPDVQNLDEFHDVLNSQQWHTLLTCDGGSIQPDQSININNSASGSNSNINGNNSASQASIEWVDVESAFRNRMNVSIIVNLSHKNLDSFFDEVKRMLFIKINESMSQHGSLKVQLILAYNSFSRLQTQIEESELQGSGWSFNEILNLEIHINKYIPLKGGNSSYVPVPKWIQNTRSVVNVQNNDNKCFIWSVLAAIHKLSINSCRVNSYLQYERLLNLDGITFPMSWKSIALFEKMNNLKINVYGIEDDNEEDYDNNDMVPFVIYADTECILKPIVKDNNNLKKTLEYQNHVPCSLGYYQKCSYDDSLSEFKFNRSINCVEWFVDELFDIAIKVDNILSNIKPMNLTINEERSFHQAKKCHICDNIFTEKNIKVRDHDHITGVYRGAAHQACNINYQDSCIIPIVFHNLSGYDAHFIIKQLTKRFPGKIELLPLNKENYISFTKYVDNTRIQLRFIDSFRFMASSIDTLAKNLENDKKTISKSFCRDNEEFKLLTKKGVFPYDYLDDWSKFDDVNLPSKLNFYSKLNDENITDELYNHATNVWKKLKIQSLGEYSDLYLRLDITLLADIFENFRENCRQAYGLDALHYYTAPGLSFDAMLKMTKIELELLTDPDMVLFIEKGIRGGLSQCSNRYAKANNRFMEKEYNPSEVESYLMYFNVNNLYGGAMSKSLSTHNFEWCTDFDRAQIKSISNDSKIGYIFEVDLEYPTNLHDLHKDLPLAPVHEKPPLPESKCVKLLATLNSKEKYVVHYQSLKQYLSLGLKLTKIHRVLKFNQSSWLKPYIDLNTQLRQQAKNEFEKSFFKLMNNAIYGKTMESVRNHREIKLVSKYDGRYGARSLIAKPNFASSKIIDDLVIIEMKRNYDINNHYGIPLTNKKVVGLMKDENNGKIMTEFIGLRSKLYSYRVENDLNTNTHKVHSRAKGVKKSAMKKIIFEDYKNCLIHEIEIFKKQNMIRSRNHNVKKITITMTKKALSWQDDKRNLQRGSTDTLPWGYIATVD